MVFARTAVVVSRVVPDPLGGGGETLGGGAMAQMGGG